MIVEYSNKNIVNDEVSKILNNPIVKFALNNNGMVAGGFVARLLTKKSLTDYFRYQGDIDIFFKSRKDYDTASEAAMTYSKILNLRRKHTAPNGTDYSDWLDAASISGFNRCRTEMSPTGYCRNFFIESTSGLVVKVQFVNIFTGNEKDVLSTFDFVNSKAMLTNTKLLFHEELPSLWEKSVLDIAQFNSPLLAHRIWKYLTIRGLKVTTQRSRKPMTDWIAKWRSKSFNDHRLQELVESNKISSHAVIELTSNPDVIPTNALAYLVGAYFKHFKVGYGYHTSWEREDVASREISKRMAI